MITEDMIKETLKNIEDPELRVDIVTLELIYNITIQNKIIYITMTLTTPTCPYASILKETIKRKLLLLGGIDDVIITFSFDPIWKPSDEVKLMLGLT